MGVKKPPTLAEEKELRTVAQQEGLMKHSAPVRAAAKEKSAPVARKVTALAKPKEKAGSGEDGGVLLCRLDHRA